MFVKSFLKYEQSVRYDHHTLIHHTPLPRLCSHLFYNYLYLFSVVTVSRLLISIQLLICWLFHFNLLVETGRKERLKEKEDWSNDKEGTNKVIKKKNVDKINCVFLLSMRSLTAQRSKQTEFLLRIRQETRAKIGMNLGLSSDSTSLWGQRWIIWVNCC